jgi:hypothetical protein
MTSDDEQVGQYVRGVYQDPRTSEIKDGSVQNDDTRPCCADVDLVTHNYIRK